MLFVFLECFGFLEVFCLKILWVFCSCVGFSGGLGLLEKPRVFWKWVEFCGSALGFEEVF